MRIISGEFKGKTINFLKNSTTRPLKDNVKENIFNVLCHSNLIKTNLKNSKVLDLYSGIGSFGIECLSRGVKKVTFVEKDTNASRILKKNLKQIPVENKILVINEQIINFLKKTEEKFNIFFLDPPYADNLFIESLSLLKKKGMFETKHIIIIHREKKSKDNFKEHINILISKQYGRSKVIFGVFN